MSGPGFHLVLRREDAKQLFAQRDPAAIRDYVRKLTQSTDYRKQGRLLELGVAWDTLHRCVTDGTLDPSGGEPPLNQAFLGGRLLYQGDDYIVSLVRPDMTPYVAEALVDVKFDQLKDRYWKLDPNDYGRALDAKDLDKAWIAFQQVRDLFDAAARELSAMVFAAER